MVPHSSQKTPEQKPTNTINAGIRLYNIQYGANILFHITFSNYTTTKEEIVETGQCTVLW